MTFKTLGLLALALAPLSSSAAISIPSSRAYSCAALNQLWSQTNDGIILIGTGHIKSEYHRDRAAAWNRGACPRGAEAYATYVTSSDAYSCQFGVACDYGSTN